MCEQIALPFGFDEVGTRHGRYIWVAPVVPMGEAVWTASLALGFGLPWALLARFVVSHFINTPPGDWSVGAVGCLLVGIGLPAIGIHAAAVSLRDGLRRPRVWLARGGAILAKPRRRGVLKAADPSPAVAIGLLPSPDAARCSRFDLTMTSGGVTTVLVGNIPSLHAARWLLRRCERHRQHAMRNAIFHA